MCRFRFGPPPVPELNPPIQWLHHGTAAHSVARRDFDRITAHCGFTFLPTRTPEPLNRSSQPCATCFAARHSGRTPEVPQ